MSAKRKPARVARGTGLERLHASAAGDGSNNNIASGNRQPHPPMTAAKHLVGEMLAAGAVFTILRRQGRPDSFIYTVKPGGDRQRCRHIVDDVKDAGASSIFVSAIAELEEAHR